MDRFSTLPVELIAVICYFTENVESVKALSCCNYRLYEVINLFESLIIKKLIQLSNLNFYDEIDKNKKKLDKAVELEQVCLCMKLTMHHQLKNRMVKGLWANNVTKFSKVVFGTDTTQSVLKINRFEPTTVITFKQKLNEFKGLECTLSLDLNSMQLKLDSVDIVEFIRQCVIESVDNQYQIPKGSSTLLDEDVDRLVDICRKADANDLSRTLIYEKRGNFKLVNVNSSGQVINEYKLDSATSRAHMAITDVHLFVPSESPTSIIIYNLENGERIKQVNIRVEGEQSLNDIWYGFATTACHLWMVDGDGKLWCTSITDLLYGDPVWALRVAPYMCTLTIQSFHPGFTQKQFFSKYLTYINTTQQGQRLVVYDWLNDTPYYYNNCEEFGKVFITTNNQIMYFTNSYLDRICRIMLRENKTGWVPIEKSWYCKDICMRYPQFLKGPEWDIKGMFDNVDHWSCDKSDKRYRLLQLLFSVVWRHRECTCVLKWYTKFDYRGHNQCIFRKISK